MVGTFVRGIALALRTSVSIEFPVALKDDKHDSWTFLNFSRFVPPCVASPDSWKLTLRLLA